MRDEEQRTLGSHIPGRKREERLWTLLPCEPPRSYEALLTSWNRNEAAEPLYEDRGFLLRIFSLKCQKGLIVQVDPAEFKWENIYVSKSSCTFLLFSFEGARCPACAVLQRRGWSSGKNPPVLTTFCLTLSELKQSQFFFFVIFFFSPLERHSLHQFPPSSWSHCIDGDRGLRVLLLFLFFNRGHLES